MDTAALAAPVDPWLLRCAPTMARGAGRVLDLACGSGSNALWLSRRGWQVVGVDAAQERVAEARQGALEQKLSAAFAVLQVVAGHLPAGPWDGLCVFHFLDRTLFPELAASLAPGGWLLYKTHLDHPLRTPGRHPANPAYRLRPGELMGAFPTLVPLHYREWLADGYAWAGLLARRGSEPR